MSASMHPAAGINGSGERQSNAAHDAVGFGQDFDDLLIMDHIVKGQCPALAVLQPFLRGLIAADVKFPCDARDIIEILVGVYVDTAILPSRKREGLGVGL